MSLILKTIYGLIAIKPTCKKLSNAVSFPFKTNTDVSKTNFAKMHIYIFFTYFLIYIKSEKVERNFSISAKENASQFPPIEEYKILSVLKSNDFPGFKENKWKNVDVSYESEATSTNKKTQKPKMKTAKPKRTTHKPTVKRNTRPTPRRQPLDYPKFYNTPMRINYNQQNRNQLRRRQRPTRRPYRPFYYEYDYDYYSDYYDERYRNRFERIQKKPQDYNLRQVSDESDDISESNETEEVASVDASAEESEEHTITTEMPTSTTTLTTTTSNSTDFMGYGPSNGMENISITYAPSQEGKFAYEIPFGNFWSGDTYRHNNFFNTREALK